MKATYRVLFVCEANICRSPLMEAVFRAGMPDEVWQADSRGTKLRPAATTVCTVAARLAGVDAEAHSPSAVTEGDLRQSQLIIAASRAEREALAALAPAMRWKTFTLGEANILGAEPPSSKEQSQAMENSKDMNDLEGYAAMLHRRRGLVVLPEPKRRLLVGRIQTSPLDVHDAHGLRPAVHRTTLYAAGTQVQTLCEHLAIALSANR